MHEQDYNGVLSLQFCIFIKQTANVLVSSAPFLAEVPLPSVSGASLCKQ